MDSQSFLQTRPAKVAHQITSSVARSHKETTDSKELVGQTSVAHRAWMGPLSRRPKLHPDCVTVEGLKRTSPSVIVAGLASAGEHGSSVN